MPNTNKRSAASHTDMWPEQDDGLSSKQKLDGDVRNMLCMFVFYNNRRMEPHENSHAARRPSHSSAISTHSRSYFFFVWQEKSNNLDYLIRIF